jgi:PKD repeat protein
VRYDWNWGDGESGTGLFQDHDFLTAGTFNVTLTVTDDTGLTGTVSKAVTVGTGNPTALMTIIKGVGGQPLNIQADGSASTATGGATITTYSFNWGDGSPIETGSAQVRQHNYGLTTGAGTYTVRLSVTDSLGRTGTVTQSVTVP